MKALILAAGLGTRLRPWTRHLPKPLFPVAGRPLLDRLIRQLIEAGCDAAAVNTHHLHEQVKTFVERQRYPIPVRLCYEPEILGTGGAISNLEDFWDENPFIVVNSDILTSIDFREVYRAHMSGASPVTLVLHDHPELNSVTMKADGTVAGFSADEFTHAQEDRMLTFTGVQVLDPLVLAYLPKAQFSSSIDAYRRMMADGHEITGLQKDEWRWDDLGTPERYLAAEKTETAKQAAADLSGADGQISPESSPANAAIRIAPLKGDGSDRLWSRIHSDHGSLMMVEHGLRPSFESTVEADAFVRIGTHLHQKGVPVPRILRHDLFSGLMVLEDLGDCHLQGQAQKTGKTNELRALYQSVIDELIRFSVEGIKGFDPAWTWQSEQYDRELILEKECLYFVEAFLQGWCGKKVAYEDYVDLFEKIADGVLENGFTGLMHRDMQSRNVMIRDGRIYFIDFQGARIGPLQYDLASLLIDPYVDLPEPMQAELFEYALKRLTDTATVNEASFRKGYEYCCITRNLQMLGAFGFLSRVKGKKWFESYIPAALNTLKRNLGTLDKGRFSSIRELVISLPAAASTHKMKK